MAYFQIEYIEPYCKYAMDEFCTQCCTNCAEDLGCKLFNDGRRDSKPDYLHFGDCENVIYETAYKGFSAKNYETKEFIDIYNPRLNCMILKTESGEYHCSKVILDGICIYPKESEVKQNDTNRI